MFEGIGVFMALFLLACHRAWCVRKARKEMEEDKRRWKARRSKIDNWNIKRINDWTKEANNG